MVSGEKRVENSSGKITDKYRHVRFRWSFFFLFALLVRQENKAAVTKENTQKKKNHSLFLSLGQGEDNKIPNFRNSIFKEGLDIKQVHKKLSQSVTSCSFRVLRERFDYLNSLYPCDYLAVSQTRKIPSGKKAGDCRVQDP